MEALFQELITSSMSFIIIIIINIWGRTLVCLCVSGDPVEEGVGWTSHKMKEKQEPMPGSHYRFVSGWGWGWGCSLPVFSAAPYLVVICTLPASQTLRGVMGHTLSPPPTPAEVTELLK